LGQFELIDRVTIAYYDSVVRFLRNFFRQEASLGHLRPFDFNMLAYGLIGLTFFQALDWGPGQETYGRDRLIELTLDLIRGGLSGPRPYDQPQDLAVSNVRLRPEDQAQQNDDLTQGQTTRQAIFQAAEKVFGQYGFNRANISEITRQAGVAQGTFYIHFKSKFDLMEGFVKYLSREMRRELRLATDQTADRREAEREGMLAFYRFLARHRRIYRVVPEFETTGREMTMWYYNKLAEGYMAGLAEGVKKGEIRDLPVPFLARSLMGFHHLIGLKWLVWNSSPQAEIPQQFLSEAVEFWLYGLDPR
ncbi:MAG: TetR/AcrR family transcriptional regulator, partial [Pseudomonadota bacterium]